MDRASIDFADLMVPKWKQLITFGATKMTKFLLKSVTCAALILSPAILSAGGLSPIVANEAVVPPQQVAAAPLVGSLNGGLVAGAVLVALLAAAAAGDSASSTSGTR